MLKEIHNSLLAHIYINAHLFSHLCIFFTFSYFFSQSCWCFLPEPFWCHWGTKRPTNGLQQKSAFNFFVGFFPDRTIIPGWCAGVRAQYGGWRTTDWFTETLFPFQILFWIDTRWFWVLKGKKEKNIRPTRSGSSSEVNGGEMRAEPKKLFLWKNSLQPKFFWPQTGKPCEYRETCYLWCIFLGEMYFIQLWRRRRHMSNRFPPPIQLVIYHILLFLRQTYNICVYPP